MNRHQALRRRSAPRVEPLEERTVLDVGDTLALSLATNLGPAPGTYTMLSEPLGDNAFGPRDVDMYRFTAAVGSILTARSSPAVFGPTMDPLLRLFDAAGNELALNDDFLTSRYGKLDYAFTTAGNYYLGVSGSPNYTYNPTVAGSGTAADEQGAYGLQLTLINPPAVSADVGDYTATAQWTDVYGYYYGNGYYVTNAQLGDGPYGARDVDMYLFYAYAGTTVTVRTQLPYATAPAVDTYARLFALGSSTQLAANDDGPSEYGLYSYLTYTITQDNYYFVGVSGYPNSTYDPDAPDSGVDGETGLYRLEIFLSETAPAPVADVGDSFVNPQIASAGGYYQLRQRLGDGPHTTRDVDMYAIYATAGMTLQTLTSRPPGGVAADTFLRLFTTAGFELAANDDGGNALYSFLSYRFTTEDVYYVAVSGYANYAYLPFTEGSGVPGASGDYLLEMMLFTGGAAPGGGPSQGGDGGADVVRGLLSGGATPAPVVPATHQAVTPRAETVLSQEERVAVQAPMESGNLPAIRPEAVGALPDQRFLLDLVFGGLV